jgi:hypothetical protein
MGPKWGRCLIDGAPTLPAASNLDIPATDNSLQGRIVANWGESRGSRISLCFRSSACAISARWHSPRPRKPGSASVARRCDRPPRLPADPRVVRVHRCPDGHVIADHLKHRGVTESTSAG